MKVITTCTIDHELREKAKKILQDKEISLSAFLNQKLNELVLENGTAGN